MFENRIHPAPTPDLILPDGAQVFLPMQPARVRPLPNPFTIYADLANVPDAFVIDAVGGRG